MILSNRKRVITSRNFKVSSFRNWVHRNNTSMPSFSLQIASSFLCNSINCNNELHTITALGRNQDSLVSMVTMVWAEWPRNKGSKPSAGNFLFSTAPQSVIHAASYPIGLPGGKAAAGCHHLVQRLRVCGAIPPCPHASSWCGGYWTTGKTLTV